MNIETLPTTRKELKPHDRAMLSLIEQRYPRDLKRLAQQVHGLTTLRTTAPLLFDAVDQYIERYRSIAPAYMPLVEMAAIAHRLANYEHILGVAARDPKYHGVNNWDYDKEVAAQEAKAISD